MTKNSEVAQLLDPEMPWDRINSATEKIRKMGEIIYMLDITISQWNEQLKRAQPHRNGRVVIRFATHINAKLGNKTVKDIDPEIGKMILMKSGNWRFFRLTKKDKYESLSDLRVGLTLPSDPLVIRLLDGIEEMLTQRDYLVNILTDLNRGTSGKLSAIQASCVRNADYCVDLSQRVKLDWTLGADTAEKTIVEARRERYEREKLKKTTAIV